MKKVLFLSCLLLSACATLKTSDEYVARGNGYLKDGKKAQAVNAFNKALLLNNKNIEAYEGRGAAYFYSGQFRAAQADFEKVLNANAYRVNVYTAYASVLAAQGDFNNALIVLNAADRLRPGHAETYFARAGVYYMLGRYDLAVADYTQVLQIRPSADVFNARGAAYQKWGKPEQAAKDFQSAKAQNIPQHLNVYAALQE